MGQAPVVVGFGFKARHGKDTAAKTIIERFAARFDVRKYAFADMLKQEVNAAIEKAGSVVELFAEMQDVLPNWAQIETDPDMTDPLCPYGKYRTLLQWWGTEYRRAQDVDYWWKFLDKKIAEDRPQFALITDLRFPNEAEWIYYLKGFKVRVERLSFDSGTNAHQSEQLLEQVPKNFWDYTIEHQDGDPAELQGKAVRVFTDICVRTGNV